MFGIMVTKLQPSWLKMEPSRWQRKSQFWIPVASRVVQVGIIKNDW